MSRSSPSAKHDSTAVRIVAAATKLFAKKGYEGTSTKEICSAAEANIAAIHYHFGSKEGLLLHILTQFGDESLHAVRRILEMPENCEELKLRLRLFLEDAVDSFIRQPDLWRIVQREGDQLQQRSSKVFGDTFLQRFEALAEFFNYAKRKKFVGQGIEPKLAARMLLSQISHQTRTDHIYKHFYKISLHDAAYRAQWIDQTIKIFLCGVRAQ